MLLGVVAGDVSGDGSHRRCNSDVVVRAWG